METSAFQLSLVPAGSERLRLLQSQGLRTDRQGGGLWEQALPAGSYRLLLSADQDQGTLSSYRGFP